MTIKKSGNGKREDAKQIAASIRKPALPTADRLERALSFAQGQMPETRATVAPQHPEPGSVPGLAAEGLAPRISAWSLMPRSTEDRQVLQARARNFSRQVQQRDAVGYEQYIRFKLGESAMYGVAYADIEKILPVARISRVPCTSAMIAGVVNYRGELLTVLDPGEIFRIQRDKQQQKSWIIIVIGNGLKAGLLVDEIDDNDEFLPDSLSPPLDGNVMVRGIDAGKVVMLNIGAILVNPSIHVDEPVNG